MRIVLASGNAGKVVELEQLLAGSGVQLVPQTTLGVSDADETGLTFVENALIKARHAARATGLPALADDSGICVDALHGAPGLYAARYSGVHGDSAANNAKLLRELDGVPMEKRTAYFIAVLVLLRHADDPAPLIAEGRWHGRILEAPRGAGGFGYDPLFLPDGSELGAAEIEPALKNRLSHRGQALDVLKARFAELA
ncbi:RdgB/HAM1 family non-canonical purine NTP pyrophosphatase [Luteibacter aegosomatissinici]|uniref:RdgB/HAM1 family non-canonical purine NTP pyrophosphatase n=1 Tax=Luteibacter aegosomatissinici TaxID=2911539 RepID=UPI001FF8D09D|nr:RdgB/HAM1 family non-canonical purine NTP pyrophosphatase [Luteibacter aegosomatissinici]UPG94017.1 RdgB/HAM1 family non-canonical purine NTP pyrophosphatase [Luteibacter aegosomatissinici]